MSPAGILAGTALAFGASAWPWAWRWLMLRMTLVGGVAFGLVATAAAATPSPEALAGLRERLAGEPNVRVLGSFGVREIEQPVVDSSGIRSAAWNQAGRQALFSSADAPAASRPGPISWSEISEVQVGQDRTGRGALIGALAGIGVGLLVAQAQNGEGLGIVGFLVGTGVAGALVGASIGRSHGRWNTVYRAGEAGS